MPPLRGLGFLVLSIDTGLRSLETDVAPWIKGYIFEGKQERCYTDVVPTGLKSKT